MTKVNEHGSTPSDLAVPVYRSASPVVRSNDQAGGKVDKGSYTGKSPNNSKDNA
jgi:hypothetical protein